VTNVQGTGLITLEDQAGPYSVANGVWCDEQDFDASTGNCANYTVWGKDPNGLFPNVSSNYNGAAFWIPASDKFGQSTFGTVWAMLRSSEKTNNASVHYPCFSPGTVFADVEFPSIQLQAAVTGMSVIVITNAVQPAETCGSGSLNTVRIVVCKSLTLIDEKPFRGSMAWQLHVPC
jgi:hypothetical protein